MSERETFEVGPRQVWLSADWSRRYGWLHAWTIVLVIASGFGGTFSSLAILYTIAQAVFGSPTGFPLVVVAAYVSGVALGTLLLWFLMFDLQGRLARRAYFKGKAWTEDARVKTWRTLAHWNPFFAPIATLMISYIWLREGNTRALSWLKGEW